MKNDLERKFALLNLLASNRYPLTRDQIFEKLSVFYSPTERKTDSTKKMFERDKVELISEGFVVTAEAGSDEVEKYSMPNHRAWLEDFQFTDSQAQLIREAIEDPSIMGQMMGQGLFALRKLLAFNAPFDLDLQGEKQGKSEESATFLKVHKALMAGKVLEVDYPSHKGKLERRYFSPYAIFYRYGRSYMIAGCHRTKTPKTITLERIKRLRVSNKAFLRQPKDFDTGKYIKTGLYNYDPKYGKIVRFRVDAQEAWHIREKHSRFIVSEGKDGSVECEFFVTNPTSFFEFIVAFGFDAEILSPPEFRRQFKKFLEKAMI